MNEEDDDCEPLDDDPNTDVSLRSDACDLRHGMAARISESLPMSTAEFTGGADSVYTLVYKIMKAFTS